MSLKDLIPILQIAIGPVILVSGIGLLLLSMTNRFGRIIDRTRQLNRELRDTTPDYRPRIIAQMRILLRRAHIMRAAIALAAISVFLAALLIIILFISAILQLNLALFITVVFITCMVCLIGSLALFISDINVSITALKLEVDLGKDSGA